MSSCELIRDDYSPAAEPYTIIAPEIPSGNIYFFITDSGLEYEVRFGRKKDNFLGNVINFGVLNEEFDNEYSLTNRGETYRIIATVIEIVRMYHSQHPTSNSYEFTGEFKAGEKQENSIRSRLYYRYAMKVLCVGWKVILFENKVTISRS
jgi:hypothetical protein